MAPIAQMPSVRALLNVGPFRAPKAAEGVAEEVEKMTGTWAMVARYHRLPRCLEDDYVVSDDVLGTGVSGAVRLAKIRGDPDGNFAVKTYNLHRLRPSQRAHLISEVQVYLSMDHPHVARLVNVYETKETLNLVMECMSGGDLFARVREQKCFTEPDASQATRQMLLAINYLHRLGTVHRDVKLENWLYEAKGSTHLKLIDFGFSKFFHPLERRHTRCGTLHYIAPEVLIDSHSSQADLWSLGVTVFAMVTGYMPFHGTLSELYGKVVRGKPLIKAKKWEPLSPNCKDFVNRLLEKDTSMRMTAREALKHPFILQAQPPKPNLNLPTIEAFQSFSRASLLRRCFLRGTSWLLDTVAVAKVRDLFLALDEDMGGTITLGELKNYLAKSCPVHEEGTLQEVYACLDINHDEEVSFSEFLAAMMAMQVVCPSDSVMRATFRNFDADQQGYITKDNLQDMFGKCFSEKSVKSIVNDAAIAQDGRLSFNDFQSFVLNGPRSRRLVHYEGDSAYVESGSSPCCTLM